MKKIFHLLILPVLFFSSCIEQDVDLPSGNVVIFTQDVKISCQDTTLFVQYKCDEECTSTIIEGDEWIEIKNAEGDQIITLEVSISENTTDQSRQGKIVVRSNTNNKSDSILITQDKAISWLNQKFVKKSVGLYFTATWCGYCPMMAEAISTVKSTNPGAFLSMTFHSTDSNVSLAFPQTNTFMRFYGLNSFPSLLIDGRAFCPNFSVVSSTASVITSLIQESNKYPTLAAAAFSTTVTGDNVSINGKLRLKANGTYQIAFAILEDGLVTTQNGYTGNYTHKNVVRYYSNPAVGEKLEVLDASEEVNFSLQGAIPSIVNRQNAKVILLVYAKLPEKQFKEINYATYGNYGEGYYVNNAFEVGLGQSQTFQYE